MATLLDLLRNEISTEIESVEYDGVRQVYYVDPVKDVVDVARLAATALELGRSSGEEGVPPLLTADEAMDLAKIVAYEYENMPYSFIPDPDISYLEMKNEEFEEWATAEEDTEEDAGDDLDASVWGEVMSI